MIEPDAFRPAVLLPNGVILEVGGFHNDGMRRRRSEPSCTTRIPACGRAPGPWPRGSSIQNPAAVLLSDGRVLVVGEDRLEEHRGSEAYLYDPGSPGLAP
jgi:hypothetical protein